MSKNHLIRTFLRNGRLRVKTPLNVSKQLSFVSLSRADKNTKICDLDSRTSVLKCLLNYLAPVFQTFLERILLLIVIKSLVTIYYSENCKSWSWTGQKYHDWNTAANMGITAEAWKIIWGQGRAKLFDRWLNNFIFSLNFQIACENLLFLRFLFLFFGIFIWNSDPILAGDVFWICKWPKWKF